MVAILSRFYDARVYEALEDVFVVSTLVKDPHIRGLLHIIKRFRHQHELGVALGHRHFDLDPTEAMCEERPVAAEDEGKGSLQSAEATTRSLVSVSRPKALSEIERLNARPNVFALSVDDGRWYPISYTLITPEEQGKEEKKTWDQDEEFLRAAADYLIENQLGNKLMLVVLGKLGSAGETRDDDDGALKDDDNEKNKNKEEAAVLEYNNQESRTSEIFSGDMVPSSGSEIKTTFMLGVDCACNLFSNEDTPLKSAQPRCVLLCISFCGYCPKAHS